jgi:hypothetical protein
LQTYPVPILPPGHKNWQLIKAQISMPPFWQYRHTYFKVDETIQILQAFASFAILIPACIHVEFWQAEKAFWIK